MDSLACGFCATFGQSFARSRRKIWRRPLYGFIWLEARWYLGGIADFGKFAMLRQLMKDRRLAVCWYLTGENWETKDRERHFDYAKHPEDFRHFAPGGVRSAG